MKLNERTIERAHVLMKAAKAMLDKADETEVVIDVLTTTVPYDGTDCDGYCLREDIGNLLEEIEEE